MPWAERREEKRRARSARDTPPLACARTYVRTCARWEGGEGASAASARYERWTKVRVADLWARALPSRRRECCPRLPFGEPTSPSLCPLLSFLPGWTDGASPDAVAVPGRERMQIRLSSVRSVSPNPRRRRRLEQLRVPGNVLPRVPTGLFSPTSSRSRVRVRSRWPRRITSATTEPTFFSGRPLVL